MNVKTPTATPRMSWPRTHWPKIALDGPDDRPGVEPPGCRQGAVERSDEGDLVLEQVEHPDRQDEVAEDGPRRLPAPVSQRQQEATGRGRRRRPPRPGRSRR